MFWAFIVKFLLSGIAFVTVLIGLFVTYVKWYEAIQRFISPPHHLIKRFPYQEKKWNDSPEQQSDEIRRFRLNVSDELLDDLRGRLSNTRYGPPMHGVNFHFGFPSDYLKKIVSYWLHEYNWKKNEAFINSFDHYTTNIEGLDIHFVRAIPSEESSTKVKVVPILAVHGWPGSFYELLKLVPLLNKPTEISPNNYAAFEVIIPSLPGYGFSSASQNPGMEPSNIARIFNTLMTRLGHEQYFIHGGDWGSQVCRILTVMYPERILGMNITMYNLPMTAYWLKSFVAKVLPSVMKINPDDKRKLYWGNFFFLLRESGYFHINATKPDTVGSCLSDSPAGLAAYILEKFSTWTNRDNIGYSEGNLTKYFNMDDLLTNVMIYWVSNSITSSCRLYKETFYAGFGVDVARAIPCDVPSLLSDFQNEIGGTNPPEAFLQPYFPKLIKVSRHTSGGHFPALECPDAVASDIWLLAASVLK